MKKLFFILALLQFAIIANAQQGVMVRFTASTQEGAYCRLDAVRVRNITKEWSQVLVYPDTTLSLNVEDGLTENIVKACLRQNYPNPFDGMTECVFSIGESSAVSFRVFSLDGRLLAEHDDFLSQGDYGISISLAEPQMAMLQVKTSRQDEVIKMLNMGYGGSNGIRVEKAAARKYSKSGRADSEGYFSIGDVMSYTGVIMQNGNEVSSDAVIQAQNDNDIITFLFDSNPIADLQLPIVATSNAVEVTASTAVCGGNVISDGGSIVTARGVCWSIYQNPTLNDYFTVNGLGTGSFMASISGLMPGKTYYVRSYATNGVGTSYGNQISFTTENNGLNAEAVFSVRANNQVVFSNGNLQYNAYENKFRFAENQYDIIGQNNHYLSLNYNGWIDLFGWGTGNRPIYHTTEESDYNVFVDWGSNSIEGYPANYWRTLHSDEWEYLLFNRVTVSGVRFAKAIVNGVQGVVLLPDAWSSSYYSFSSANVADADFSVNIVSLTAWLDMESHGAVFLPAAGFRSGKSVYDVGVKGDYWTSSLSEYDISLSFSFTRFRLNIKELHPDYGQSVRLVTNLY